MTLSYLSLITIVCVAISNTIYSIHNDTHDRRNRVFLLLQKEECTAQGGSQQGNCAMGLYIKFLY